MRQFRDRFGIEIPDEKLEEVPYFHPGPDSEEIKYLLERRKELGGPLPRRGGRARRLRVSKMGSSDGGQR